MKKVSSFNYCTIAFILILWNFILSSSSESDYSLLPQISISQPDRLKSAKPNSHVIGNKSDRILLTCCAQYPVQWVYRGGGIPEFRTKTTTTTESVKSTTGEELLQLLYVSELGIHLAKEEHTGEYQCASTEFPNKFNRFHLYVPGEAIFVPSSGRHVYFSPNETSLRIPCTTSNPQAQVSLHRSKGGILIDVLEEGQQYNPRIGFELPINISISDPTGTYVCRGRMDKLFRLIEYTVSSIEYEKLLLKKSCDPSPCGRNGYCLMLREKPICQCRDQFSGNPYQESGCTRSCQKDLDCSSDTYCNRRSNQCEDPCDSYTCDLRVSDCKVSNHLPRCYKNNKDSGKKSCGTKEDCGTSTGSECIVKNGLQKCSCINGFINTGFPEVSCTSSCQKDTDCPLAQICDYPICVNPCLKFNPCTENEVCRIVRHSLVCSASPSSTKKDFIPRCPYNLCSGKRRNQTKNSSVSPLIRETSTQYDLVLS